METSIFERGGKTWTRFKVKVKELRIYAKLRFSGGVKNGRTT